MELFLFAVGAIWAVFLAVYAVALGLVAFVNLLTAPFRRRRNKRPELVVIKSVYRGDEK